MGRGAQDWRSWKLSIWWMTFNLFVEASVIIALTTLTAISATRDGFIDIQYERLSFGTDLTWQRIGASQLPWTLVPAVVVALIGIGFNTMVTTTAERQPFVELNRDEENARNVGLTLLLDYPAEFLLTSWYVAWKNRHFWLGLAMLAHLLNLPVLVSLTSNVFNAHTTSSSGQIGLYSPVDLDVSALDQRKDLRAAVDVASAIHAYGSAPPVWMTKEYALQPFYADRSGLLGNVSVSQPVYSAKLDCKIVDVDHNDLNLTYNPRAVPYQGDVNVTFVDRGCPVVHQSFTVSSTVQRYAQDWYQTCNGSVTWNDRIGIFVATYSDVGPQKLANFTVISCIPSYQNVSASILMSYAANSDPQVISINPISNGTTDMHGRQFHYLHAGLHQYNLFDPSDTYLSTAFGRTVYELATKLSKDAMLTPDLVLNATQNAYVTLFAALASQELMYSLPVAKTMTGMNFQPTVRLHVAVPIACIILGLFILMLVSSIGLFVQAQTRPSILREEPVGLLGKAIILFKSNVSIFVESLLHDNPDDNELIKLVKKRYTIKKSKCFAIVDEDTSRPEIFLQDLQAKPFSPPNRKERFKAWFSKFGKPQKQNTPSPTSSADQVQVADADDGSDESHTTAQDQVVEETSNVAIGHGQTVVADAESITTVGNAPTISPPEELANVNSEQGSCVTPSEASAIPPSLSPTISPTNMNISHENVQPIPASSLDRDRGSESR